jgi:hypothetical protein
MKIFKNNEPVYLERWKTINYDSGVVKTGGKYGNNTRQI